MKRYLIYLLAFTSLLSSCEINQKDVLPGDGFLKIYNHPDESLAFYPESLLEIPGEGYIILSSVKYEDSELEYPETCLIRTDEKGEMIWTQYYAWLSPVPVLFKSGGSIGFVAMNEDLEAYAVLVDPSSGEISSQYDLGIAVPLYCHLDSKDELLVLSYNLADRSSQITRFNNQFAVSGSVTLAVNTDLELDILRHLNLTGEQFPFFIGEFESTGQNGYYVSCFTNYTLKTVFLNGTSLASTGDIFSFQTQEAISSLTHKRELMFSISGYYEGNNYLITETDLDVNRSQSIKDFPAQQRYDLTYKAPVVSCHLETSGNSNVLLASQTNDNAIIVLQYSKDSDSLLNTHYRHFDQRVEVAGIIACQDKGSAVLAGTHILGKYKRPVLIKDPESRYWEEE